jgi:hypothetical protein
VLLAAALDQAALKAWSQLVLWVVKTNLGACSFYEHMGFRCDSASRIDSRLGVDAPVVRYRIGLL